MRRAASSKHAGTRAVTFSREGRAWVARQYRNSEGAPEYFWQVKPVDQTGNFPDYREWKRACAAFDRWLEGAAG